MPKIAFLPIFMLWLGVDDVSKISIGLQRHLLGDELLWSARSLGTGERQLPRGIILPAALRQIVTGRQMALPISIIVTRSGGAMTASREGGSRRDWGARTLPRGTNGSCPSQISSNADQVARTHR
jgi:ABC-type nitrate/sulfonate/bicarbonate transport system permease component